MFSPKDEMIIFAFAKLANVSRFDIFADAICLRDGETLTISYDGIEFTIIKDGELKEKLNYQRESLIKLRDAIGASGPSKESRLMRWVIRNT